jgi:quercetin dioxygenase-like cupin family protein
MPPIEKENDALDDAFEERHEEVYSHLDKDGDLRMIEWATSHGIVDGKECLTVDDREGEYDMAHATTTGDPLVSNGFLGVDMIRVEEGDGFVPHTHPGDHILIPVVGTSTITYDGTVYESNAGSVYLIDGEVPHAVGAITNAAIMAVGAPHAPIDSEERMKPVEYDEVSTEFDDMQCLICDSKAGQPEKLHDTGCQHCPCHECIGKESTQPIEREADD